MPNTVITAIAGLIICLFVNDTQANRKKVCILVCICFILQAGMRDYMHSTNDTYNYLRSYWALLNDTLPDVFRYFDEWNKTYKSRDPGYSLFVKITQIIYPDFRFFLLLVATIISVPLVKIIYNYTNSLRGIVLAVMIYESLFANFFETGIRQTIAMGIIYLSLPYVIKRNWKMHYILLFLAYTMHSSALIFSPFYFLVKLRQTKRLLIWALLLTPLFMSVAPQLIVFLGDGTMFENYVNTTVDNLGTPVFSALLFAVATATYFLRKHFIESDIKSRVLLVAVLCALVLMPSTWVNSNFIRLVFYYLVFLMPLIPKLIDCAAGENPSNKNIYAIACGLALIVLTWH